MSNRGVLGDELYELRMALYMAKLVKDEEKIKLLKKKINIVKAKMANEIVRAKNR